MNGHTYRLFQNIFNAVQTEGKGEINMATITTQKCILIMYQLKG